MDHDNEWTVATLKAYFDALRKEDEKAIVIFQRELTNRFDKLDDSFNALKTSVSEFHASFGGSRQTAKESWLRITTVLTIILAVITIFADLWFHIKG